MLREELTGRYRTRDVDAAVEPETDVFGLFVR
jgi:hypothetical protein